MGPNPQRIAEAFESFAKYEWEHCALAAGDDPEERYALRDQVRHFIAESSDGPLVESLATALRDGDWIEAVEAEHTNMGESCENCKHQFPYDNCVACGDSWPCSAISLARQCRAVLAQVDAQEGTDG